jgi:hypothetical protein
LTTVASARALGPVASPSVACTSTVQRWPLRSSFAGTFATLVQYGGRCEPSVPSGNATGVPSRSQRYW